jgi:hypothetical protein
VAHTKAVNGVIDQEKERNKGKETNKKAVNKKKMTVFQEV